MSRKLYECIGKIPLITFTLAKDVATRNKTKLPRVPYKCSFCNFWHIGTYTKRKKK